MIQQTQLTYQGRNIGSIVHLYHALTLNSYVGYQDLQTDMKRTVEAIPRYGLVNLSIGSAASLTHIFDFERDAGFYEDMLRQKDFILIKRNLSGAVERLEALDMGTLLNQFVAVPYANMPTSELHVYVLPSAKDDPIFVEKFKGVTALTTDAHHVIFYINPVDGTVQDIRLTLAHEYCHSVRMERPRAEEWTFLEGMVDEGLAEAFREEIYPGEANPMLKKATEDEVNEAWKHYKSILGADQGLFYDAFMFSESKLGGFTLGYEMVLDVLKRAGMKVRDIVHMDSREIIEMSRFKM